MYNICHKHRADCLDSFGVEEWLRYLQPSVAFIPPFNANPLNLRLSSKPAGQPAIRAIALVALCVSNIFHSLK